MGFERWRFGTPGSTGSGLDDGFRRRSLDQRREIARIDDVGCFQREALCVRVDRRLRAEHNTEAVDGRKPTSLFKSLLTALSFGVSSEARVASSKSHYRLMAPQARVAVDRHRSEGVLHGCTRAF